MNLDFFRGPLWASPPARAEWEPKVAAARQAWETLEVASVALGARSSALVIATMQEHIETARRYPHLLMVPLSVEADGRNRTAFTRDVSFASFWQESWRKRDDDAIGGLLGFPSCCIASFHKTWNEEQKRDTTITQDRASEQRATHIGSSVLLRWLGVRLVPHLPCSYGCHETEQVAEMMISVGRSVVEPGFQSKLRCILELLALPTVYESLHGIGSVTTPHFRFEFSTDYYANTQAVRRTFLRHPVTDQLPVFVPEPETWADNGFSSPEAMEASHDVVTRACAGLSGRLLDLGCGDGALMERLRRELHLTGPWGVEMNAAVARRGAARYPNVTVSPAKIQEWVAMQGQYGPVYDVVLLMPGRLLEMSAEDAAKTREVLRDRARSLVVYAYGDWSEEGLRRLCELAELPAPRSTVSSAGVEAGVISW